MTLTEETGAALATDFLQERLGVVADSIDMEALMYKGFLRSPACTTIMTAFGTISVQSGDPPRMMLASFMSLVIFAYQKGYGQGQADTMRDALHIQQGEDTE